MTLAPALNAATAGEALDAEDFIDLAGRTGFRWIEFNGGQMPGLIALGPDAARQRLAAADVRIASFFLPVDWRSDESRFHDGMAGLPDLSRFVAALGATCCCTYLFPNMAFQADEARALLRRRFASVATVLEDHGLRFGLEFLGPAHFRSDPGYTFIYRMEDMLAFAEEIGPNVGILVDSLHWHCLGSDVGALAAVPADRLVYAHINDVPPVPVEQQRDDDRLLPGEGVLDLAGFVAGLTRAGYAGPVGIEVDGPHLRSFFVDEAATRARRSWTALASRLGASLEP